MKIIQLMFISIILLLTSFSATIYMVAGRGAGVGAGGGRGGAGLGLGFGLGGFGLGGFGRGGGSSPSTPSSSTSSAKSSPSSSSSSSGGKGGKTAGAFVGPGDTPEEEDEEESVVGEGAYGGSERRKGDKGGGEPSTVPFVIPKKQPPGADEEKKLPPPLPQNCKPEVKKCVEDHIHGNAGEPEQFGSCCGKFRNSKSCVCNFLISQDPNLNKAANGILIGCHFKRPSCFKTPVPQECKPELRNCINIHILGGGGEPRPGPCCDKFKNSRRCVCRFITSKDPNLSRAGQGVVRGCNFAKPNCTKA